LSLLNAAGGKNKQEPRSKHSSSNDCKLCPMTLTYDLREFQREFAYPGHLFRNSQLITLYSTVKSRTEMTIITTVGYQGNVLTDTI